MKDTEIAKKFDLPYPTLAGWKKAPKENWRRKLYHFMKDKLEKDERLENKEEHY